MQKSYHPPEIEARSQQIWERADIARPAAAGTPYCIQLPPPNVTGTLHMGHAFQQTLMDVLIRYHRMRGHSVLWQCGTDHAGIATQKIVENQLAAEGSSRQALGREAFVERVWAWKAESGSTITRQMRRLGASCDWSRERFTMDPGLSAAVRRVFVRWYRDGLIYRGLRLVHWDPVLGTAVSDLEVEATEREGSLWLIQYPAADGGEGLTVATTRPETLLGDVAVAVHPDDPRHAHRIGSELRLPLTDRTIPVIADAGVDPAFGTGAVKITPAHDFHDFEIGRRHGLAPRTVLTLDARIRDDAPGNYAGLDRYEARRRMVADLASQGLLVETRKHQLMLPVSQRSEAVTEPMLTEQWFVDLTREVQPDGRPGGRRAITEPALAAVRDGHIGFVPESWAATYAHWLENIQDWCISRQLWWGHRIPAWTDEAGQLYVGEDLDDALRHGPPPVGALTQDPDVLDTWFSSALWPFSTLGWPGEGEQAAEWQAFRRFLPSSVLVTGFDIIFFWVARMVMATLYFVGREPDGDYAEEYRDPVRRVPFRTVYINALVRDAEGQKMSKSKGNTLDPLDLIDGVTLPDLLAKSTASLLLPQVRERVEKRIRREYPQGIAAVGADALRFTFAALATQGRTINFDLKRCEGYKNFCNKLWNAARFVLINCADHDPDAARAPEGAEQRWIRAELGRTIAEMQAQMTLYRFDLVAQAGYAFVWNTYCDWFVELAKPRLAGEAAQRQGVQHSLLLVLDAILKLLHPIVPFLTEVLWQELTAAHPSFRTAESLALCRQPEADEHPDDPAACAEVAWLQQVLGELRRIRSEIGVHPGATMTLCWRSPEPADGERLLAHRPALALLARVGELRELARDEEPVAAAALVGKLELRVPLAGLVDLDAERARIVREIQRLETEIARCQGKLGSARFVDGAPPEIVAQERARLAEFSARAQAMRAQQQRLG